MFKKIMLAIDNLEHSKKAIEYARDLGIKYNSEIVLLNIYYIPEYFNAHKSSHYIYLRKVEENMLEHGKKMLETLKDDFENNNIKVKTIIEKGTIGPEIIKKAESENCDLIIVGTRGLGNIKSLLISSVSNYVIHNSKCPVLLIH